MKTKIVELRQQGHSVKEIEQLLGCSRSTASKHCRDVILDDAAKRRLQSRIADNALTGSKAFVESRRALRELVVSEAKTEWPQIRASEWFGFIGLYWGEGNKKSGYVGVANSDPDIVMICLKAFKHFSPQTTKTATIRYYPDHDQLALERFWATRLSGVVIKMVDVTTLDKRAGRRRQPQHGMCYLQFSDWRLLTKLLTWIECWKNEAGVAQW